MSDQISQQLTGAKIYLKSGERIDMGVVSHSVGLKQTGPQTAILVYIFEEEDGGVYTIPHENMNYMWYSPSKIEVAKIDLHS